MTHSTDDLANLILTASGGCRRCAVAIVGAGSTSERTTRLCDGSCRSYDNGEKDQPR